MNLIDKLTAENPCPEAWENKDENGRPRSELGYIRADHDGHRWWNTVWPVHNDELFTPELAKEFDGVYDAFIEAFPNLAALQRFCGDKAEATADSTEFNVYLEEPLGFYWFRLITRKGDYNLYLHCISKAALQSKTGGPK